MRVELLTDRPAERFAVGARLYPEGSAEALTIVEARPAAPGWVLRFREVPTRDDAEAFRLTYLEAEAGPGDALRRGEYHWHELVGVAVRDVDGGPLGSVRDVYRAGAADVVEVAGGPRGDFDLPLARPFVRELAPRRGWIVVDAEALDLPAPGSIPPPRPPRPPRPRRATRRHPAVPAAASPGAEGSPGADGPAPAAEGPPPGQPAAHDPDQERPAGDGPVPPSPGAADA